MSSLTGAFSKPDNGVAFSKPHKRCCTNESPHNLLSVIFFFRASSVLQGNKKEYGPMNALKVEDSSSCWYSDGKEGSTQSLAIHFGRQVLPLQLKIQFQAGFVAESCQVQVHNQSGGWDVVEEFEPSDTHEVQDFPVECKEPSDAVKIVFDEFTDFYGRVMVYQLSVWGQEKPK